MARKPENDHALSAKTLAHIKSLRSAIDKFDLQILKLVNERAAAAGEIGRLKNETSAEVFNPVREEEVLKNVIEASKGPLDETTIRAIFREIISGSRALQKIIKVAYLGPEYSYSHLAAVERFGHDVEYMRVGSIMSVFEEVNRSHVDYGVAPLENSTDGGVSDSLDMFMRLPHLKICAEVRLRIHHNLLANCDQEQIRRVYSKPQALAQCRNWLSKNLPHADLKDVSSTAVAAQMAQQEPGAGAVASRQAAVKYGLRMLFTDIEDYPHNETRFAVIGQNEAARSGADKTALMFKVPHHPGSLVDALDVFKNNKLNLTWIESFPAKSESGKSEYMFFVDFEGHLEDPKVKRAIQGLEKHCEQLVVLGSFPIATVS
jgi:chorismate mutase/prephenate dehydratase